MSTLPYMNSTVLPHMKNSVRLSMNKYETKHEVEC